MGRKERLFIAKWSDQMDDVGWSQEGKYYIESVLHTNSIETW